MWQRFTERARKVVFYAQQEAQKTGEGYVSTEHLLLGITSESDCSAARVLDKLGVNLRKLRSEIEQELPSGEGTKSQEMTLTPRAKHVMDLAYDEAQKLTNNYIGTEHLLLGLIREESGLSGRVLKNLGIQLEDARRETKKYQREKTEGVSKSESMADKPTVTRQSRIVASALDKARLFVQHYESTHFAIEPHHVLIALLTDPSEGLKVILQQTDTDTKPLLDHLRTLLNYAEAPIGKHPSHSPHLTQIINKFDSNTEILDSLALLELIWESDADLDPILAQHFGIEKKEFELLVNEFRRTNPFSG